MWNRRQPCSFQADRQPFDYVAEFNSYRKQRHGPPRRIDRRWQPLEAERRLASKLRQSPVPTSRIHTAYLHSWSLVVISQLSRPPERRHGRRHARELPHELSLSQGHPMKTACSGSNQLDQLLPQTIVRMISSNRAARSDGQTLQSKLRPRHRLRGERPDQPQLPATEAIASTGWPKLCIRGQTATSHRRYRSCNPCRDSTKHGDPSRMPSSSISSRRSSHHIHHRLRPSANQWSAPVGLRDLACPPPF